MQHIRRIIGLHVTSGLSVRLISRALNVPPSTVADYIRRYKAGGLSPADIQDLNDRQVYAALFPEQAQGHLPGKPLPDFALHQNYPNPFNPSTTIRFDLPEAAEIHLVVYDLMGREVIHLVDGCRETGYHQLVWNGRDARGREVPTGLYIARMVTPTYTRSIKLVLLR